MPSPIRYRPALLLLAGAMLLLLAPRAGAISVVAEDAPATVPLRVMSYNILVGLGPVPSWQTGGTDPTENLHRIADYIADEGGDIVLLQEVDSGNARTRGVDVAGVLGERLGFHHVFAPAYVNDAGGMYGIALLSRWPIIEHRVVELFKPDYSLSHPHLPDYFSEQRVALLARIDTPRGDLNVINTHLGLTEEQRLMQLRQIAELIVETNEEGPVIFGGDLNAEPDAMEILPVRRLLRDCYHGFPDGRGMPGNMRIAERFTFPYDEPDRCIDYLFVSADDFDVSRTVVPDVRLSDHRPVVSDLVWKTPTR